MALKRENESLKNLHAKYQELFDYLRCMPEDAAQATLRRLRLTAEPGNLLSQIDGESLRPIFEQTLPPRIPPITKPNLEFELMTNHPQAYPALDTSDDATSSGNPLARPLKRRLLEENVIAGASMDPNDHMRQAAHIDANPANKLSEDMTVLNDVAISSLQFDFASPYPRSESAPNQRTGFYGPAAPPQYCDRRLARVDVRYWTAVAVPKDLALRALSLYLQTDHPLLGLFDADLFIDDLVSKQLRYCSPFLVSSLLSWACVCYPLSFLYHGSHLIDFSSKCLLSLTVKPTSQVLPSWKRPRNYGGQTEKPTV